MTIVGLLLHRNSSDLRRFLEAFSVGRTTLVSDDITLLSIRSNRKKDGDKTRLTVQIRRFFKDVLKSFDVF